MYETLVKGQKMRFTVEPAHLGVIRIQVDRLDEAGKVANRVLTTTDIVYPFREQLANGFGSRYSFKNLALTGQIERISPVGVLHLKWQLHGPNGDWQQPQVIVLPELTRLFI